MTHVVTEKVTYKPNKTKRNWDGLPYLEGHFKLSDGTNTKFAVTHEQSWHQWGNSYDNLGVTIDRIEELEAKLHEGYYG
jgi:uncharacterized protein YxjI